jgi:hypothetical protein
MLCIIRCRAFFIAAGLSGRKESKMIKPIKIKKNNSEKNSKPEKTADEISIFINLDDLEPAPESAPKYDCDMSPEEILASEIVFSLAGKAAEGFTNAVDGLNLISIKQLIGRLEEAVPRDAVSMLQAVFLSNGKRTDAEMLDLLDICAEHYEGSYDEFVDMFFQTDEIDWFAVEHWLDEYAEPTEGMKIVNGRLLDVEGDCNM